MAETTFESKVLLGEIDGVKTYLAAPSWDCGWYWGFGYIQNEYLHTHCDYIAIEANTNMKDALINYFDKDTLTLSEGKLWTLCELMTSFYTLKEVAELYHRGGSHYTTNPLKDLLKNDLEYKRINEELLPKIFDEIYKLFV